MSLLGVDTQEMTSKVGITTEIILTESCITHTPASIHSWPPSHPSIRNVSERKKTNFSPLLSVSCS